MTISSLSFSAKLPTHIGVGTTNTNGAAAPSGKKQTPQVSDQGATITGGLYGQGIHIIPEGSQTNGNLTTTAFALVANGPADNTNSGPNQQSGNAVNIGPTQISVQNISDSSDDLSATDQISNTQPPPPVPQPQIFSNDAGTDNTNVQANQNSTTNVNNLQASASGSSLNEASAGNPTPQTIRAVSSASPTATAQNPGTGTNTNNPVQSSNFSSANTASSSAIRAYNNASGFSSSSSNDNSASSSNSFASQDSSSGSQPSPSSGGYTALANASASTIRGGGLNVVA